MPLYEYECQQCSERIERIQRFSDPPLTTCPSCEGELRRLLHAPAVQFKGSGWYVTDYGGKTEAGKSGEGKSASEGGDSSSSDKAKKETGKSKESTNSKAAKSD